MKNEVLLRPRDEDELKRFLQRTHGEVVETPLPAGLLEARPAHDRVRYEQRFRLVRLDTSGVDLASLVRVGVNPSRMTFKDRGSAQTVAAALELAREGFRIELNGLALPQQALLLRTAENGGANGFTQPGMQSGFDATGNGLTNIARAWQLVRAHGIQARVPVAIIDSGFWLTGTTPADAQGQADFPNILLTWNVISGNVNAGGPNVMTCGGASCPWHGYQAASVAFALPDNAAGVAGSGGYVSDPILIRVGGTAHQQVRATWIAYLAGARVISLSAGWSCAFCMTLGGLVGADDRSMLQDAVAWFEKNNTVVVAAAGNDNEDVVSNHVYPCRAVNVCVGATRGFVNQPASYSNFGASVTIFAPTDLTSLVPGNIAQFGGTSASTPLVAGVIAMMISVDPNASVARIRSALIDSAWKQPPTAGGGKVDRWLNAYGAVLLMINGRIRDDDREFQDPLQLDFAAGGGSQTGRTLNSGGDVDRYRFNVGRYSTASIDLQYMQGLNRAFLDLSPLQQLPSRFGMEGVAAASTPNQIAWSAALLPPGSYELTTRGLGPNLYNLNVAVAPASLPPDQFDLGPRVVGGAALIGHNDIAPTAANMRNSIYHLTLHRDDGSDVDFFSVQGGPRVIVSLASEHPIDISLSDIAGSIVDQRSGITSASLLIPRPSQYLLRVAGPQPTRYIAGRFTLPANFSGNPVIGRMKVKPRPFPPRNPPPNVVLPPLGEELFLLAGRSGVTEVSVRSPGEIELSLPSAPRRLLASSTASSEGWRVLSIPRSVRGRAVYVRVLRDDRHRDVAMQPLIVLDLKTTMTKATTERVEH